MTCMARQALARRLFLGKIPTRPRWSLACAAFAFFVALGTGRHEACCFRAHPRDSDLEKQAMNETLQLVAELLAATATSALAIVSRSAPYRAWLEAPLDVDDRWSSPAR
jgi:hypothetical protein